MQGPAAQWLPVQGVPSLGRSILHGLQPVDVLPLLLGDGDVRAEGLHLGHVQIGVHGAGLVLAGGQHLGPGVHDRGVAPGLVLETLETGRRARHDEALVVDCPRTGQELVVLRAGGGVEGAGVEDGLCALCPHQHGQLGEAHVVADGHAHLAPGGLEDRGLGARRERVRLLEGHLPRDVDVEEVDLAVLAEHRAPVVNDHAGVVELPVLPLRVRTAADEDAPRLCHLSEHRHRRAVLRAGRAARRRHLLRVAVEVLPPVGAVPALGQDHQLRPLVSRRFDGLPGPGEVGRLLGADLQLAERNL
mmetsp:Transcript_54205/g.170410  ORF Transcript_54205/g.170410 Transcript_54205/m.170410 type:complete len:303 (-) Transcript_54205:125-1033(-)